KFPRLLIFPVNMKNTVKYNHPLSLKELSKNENDQKILRAAYDYCNKQREICFCLDVNDARLSLNKDLLNFEPKKCRNQKFHDLSSLGYFL
ncbi:25678_t:CDS:1, partial [Gigaspora margarita]